jgi:predicted branched-subunit amino acid permease
MRLLKQTLADTIHLLAAVAVICMLIALVIARQEPAWAEFMVQSVIVLAGSAVLARIIKWSGRR